RKVGVIGFGTRADLAKAFEAFKPQDFDRYALDPRRLRFEDSVELGLFYDAICQAIANKTHLRRAPTFKGRLLYLPDIEALEPQERAALARLSIDPARRLGTDGPRIHEGFLVNLDYGDLRLWMVLEPKLMITVDGTVPYQG